MKHASYLMFFFSYLTYDNCYMCLINNYPLYIPYYK
nr:MAG TPA_asm: hypothetical protein [Caudoviricetes sp.]